MNHVLRGMGRVHEDYDVQNGLEIFEDRTAEDGMSWPVGFQFPGSCRDLG